MQYSAGTVRVTQGSPLVYSNGANWAGVNPGAAFGVQGEGIFYTVQQYSPPDHLVLTAPYRGVTNASALYVIVNDFTQYLGLPLINRGDLETATIFDWAMIKLESTYSGTWGDMFKTVYDRNNNGIVDAAESVPWTGITGVPATFPPSPHAPTHLDNGTDPIPIVTPGRTGLVPRLSNTPTTYLNGIGGFSDPTTLLTQNFMAKATYDTNNNGVVDTCDSLAWNKLTGIPATFFPAAHAPTHLDNGTDPIAIVTTQRTGLAPTLSGDSTTYLNGLGDYTKPVGPALTVKGTVPTAPADLPPTGSPGDVWVAQDTGHGWAWNGTAWVDIGPVSAGPAGPQGNPGPVGNPAYTTTTAVFTVPAVGQSVTITVGDTSWMTPGEYVWVATAGGGTTAATLKIVSKSGNTVVLENPLPSVGVAGPPGPQGPVGMNWRGNWSSANHYAIGDGVYDANGDSYIAVAANFNDPPPSANWNILAAGGSTWWNGHGPPQTIPAAKTGDYYLDVDSGLSYVMT